MKSDSATPDDLDIRIRGETPDSALPVLAALLVELVEAEDGDEPKHIPPPDADAAGTGG